MKKIQLKPGKPALAWGFRNASAEEAAAKFHQVKNPQTAPKAIMGHPPTTPPKKK